MTSSPDTKRWWLDQPENIEKIFKALVAVCVLLVVADLVHHRHVEFEFEELPPIQVKGKAKPLKVYSVLSRKG